MPEMLANLASKIRRATQLGPRLLIIEIFRRINFFLHLKYKKHRAKFFKTTLSLHKLKKLINHKHEWQKHFSEIRNIKIFPGLEDPFQTANLIRTHCPQATAAIIKEATAICDNKFYYFGQEFCHKNEIDWHLGWPSIHYTKIIYGAQLKPSQDIKITWELGRFLFSSFLGEAYALTKDEKYAQNFFRLLESFDKQNPCEFGPHWLCAMEVALRAINISIGYLFFRKSIHFTEEQITRILRMLYEHATFIEQNLEKTSHVTSNHYLSDLTGLFFISTLFPEFKDSTRWQKFSWNELLNELEKQVYEDGADYEASISYHRLVTEIFFYTLQLGEFNGLKIPSSSKEKLEKMFEFVWNYIRPDGLAPQIGDTDNGQVITLTNRCPTDHSYLLPFGALLQKKILEKSSWENLLPKELPEIFTETLWLFGYIPTCNLEALSSKAFPKAGIYVLRNSNNYLIVDCGDNGIGGLGSHGHSDALSFELWANGTAWLIDPGTYTYTGNLEARHVFRSTDYHNTAKIDDQEINSISINTPFAINTNVVPKVLKWETNSSQDILEASHDGYKRLEDPVTHTRKITFNKTSNHWEFEDSFAGNNLSIQHKIELFFNFGEKVKLLEISSNYIRATDDKKNNFIIRCTNNIISMQSTQLERWFSPGYGEQKKSTGVKWEINTCLPFTLQWEIRCPTENSIQ